MSKATKYLCSSKSRALWHRKDGATIVEFAVIAPVFFLILMGIVEFGLIFFAYTVIEGAVAYGGRITKTGFYTGTSREDYIKNKIWSLSAGILNPSLATVTMLAYKSYKDIGDPEPCLINPCGDPGETPGVDFIDINGNGVYDLDQGAAGAGTKTQVVLIKVDYPWPVFTPVLRNLIGDASGHFVVTGRTTVLNEDF